MGTFFDIIKKRKEECPKKTAFVDINRTVSYEELYEESCGIAGAIIERLEKDNSPIVIFLDRSVYSISSILGVVFSGNFYTVVDVSMPTDRISTMMDIFEPVLVLTQRKYEKRVLECIPNTKLLLIDDLCIDFNVNAQVEEKAAKIYPLDPMYVLFTSGSTGIPKGIVTSHHAVLEAAKTAVDIFGIIKNDVIGAQAPFYFVLSLIDVFGTIYAGATAHIIPSEYFMSPLKLIEYIYNNKVTFLNWVTSAYEIIDRFDALQYMPTDNCIRMIIFSGERINYYTLRSWKKIFYKCVFVNAYGSTEVTDGCTYYVIDELQKEKELDDKIPIGKFYPNARGIIINDLGKQAKIGEIGELFISSTSMSDGYYKDMEKTREVFVQNPLHNNYPDIVYKTGDLVTLDGNENLIFVGRIDNQIKKHGYRIELGEIEKQAEKNENVDKSCCVFVKEKKIIILFYVGSATSKYIDEFLKAKLPPYMIPDRIIKLEKFKYNLNGKIDRQVLLRMTEEV